MRELAVRLILEVISLATRDGFGPWVAETCSRPRKISRELADRAGKVETLLNGLARPQGLAFSPEGDLWIAAAYGGKKGVLRYSFRSHELVHHIAGPMLVGLAMDTHDCFLADSHSLYRVRLGSPSRELS